MPNLVQDLICNGSHEYLQQATKVQEQAQRAEQYLKHLRECFPQKVLEQSTERKA